MLRPRWLKWTWVSILGLVALLGFAFLGRALDAQGSVVQPPAERGEAAKGAGDYIILAWNNLGMHCYDGDFQDIAILPPYNTLRAQVLRVGDPPQLITTGITLTYVYTDNTYSVGKTNFWDYAPALFGITLPQNIGLMGKGLSGTMDLAGDHFEVEGIPLTEYRDSDLVNRYPYQVATVVAYAAGGLEVARTEAVTPVSTEMNCANCHCDTCDATTTYPITPTGKVETNILALHDYLNAGHYPPGHPGPLLDRRPVLCAECHASAALGAPGVAGVKSLSTAMHYHHRNLMDITPDTAGCYNCHPGFETQCLRDVMSQQVGMNCTNCHGVMAQVALNSTPWVKEPRCDRCHGSGYAQDQALYQMSREHGSIYCEACHDSTHATAPSREPNDAIKFVALQGHSGTLRECTVCHLTMPAGPGPHGIPAPAGPSYTWGPEHVAARSPGEQASYVHGLYNTGDTTDTYDLRWGSSQDWAVAIARAGGITYTLPDLVMLAPGQAAFVYVTVTVPSTTTVRGWIDRTVVTATSKITELSRPVTDVTLVPVAPIYLPLVAREQQ